MHAQTETQRETALSPWGLLLLAGDLVALFLFVLVGQMDHDLLPGANPLWFTLARGWPSCSSGGSSAGWPAPSGCRPERPAGPCCATSAGGPCTAG